MKIKKIKITTLILAGLIISSFAFFSIAQEKAATDKNIILDTDQDGLSDAEEKTYDTDPLKKDTDGDSYSDGIEVNTGYDPLKPAPGDRIVEAGTSDILPSSNGGSNVNMTQALLNKVTTMVDSADGTGAEVGMLEIENTIQDVLQTQISEDEIPPIDKENIKIKKQDYKGLPPEVRAAKEKEDFTKYLTSVSYIVSSNSPAAITTEQDARSIFDSLGQGLTSAITTGNTSKLSGVINSAEKSKQQLEYVEVPEKDLDVHVKGLTYLNYALTFKDGVKMNYIDPVSTLVSYSKMQSLTDTVTGYAFDVENKLSQYGLDIEKPFGVLLGLAGDTPTSTASPSASADPGTSMVVATPQSVPADDSTTSTITVTLRDASTKRISGKAVSLSKTAGPGTPTIYPTSATSNASGITIFTVKSGTAGTAVFTATDNTDSIIINQTASVNFTADTTTIPTF